MTNTKEIPARLVRTREMAERLGIDWQTLLRWGREGKIPVVRLTARALFYDPEAVIGAIMARGLKAPVKKARAAR